MKILIVTVYNSYNYGSFLQAESLYNFIKENNHMVYFYDFKCRNLLKACFRKIKKTLKSKNSFLGKIREIVFELKEYLILRKAWKKLPSTKKKDEKIDSVVLGSDEIWNIARKTCQEFEFWGDGFECNKISYAPSINIATEEDFKETKYVNLLNQINHISVRDEYSRDVLTKFTDKSINVVLDPTLLTIPKCNKEYKNKDKYIAVYLFSEHLNKKEIEKIIEFARSKELKLISVGQYISWCDECVHSYEGMPFFVYENAEYIITNTFHGTAYAINYNKQFISFAKNKNKIIELLNCFGLEDRNVNEDSNLAESFSKMIDYSKVNSKLDNNREISKKYLLNSWEDKNGNFTE